jgi:hypothetical protein
MLALLPAAFFAQVCFYLLQRTGYRGFRESLLKGALISAAVVAFGTELLSIFRVLDYAGAAASWVAINLAAGAAVVHGIWRSRDRFAAAAECLTKNTSGWLAGEAAPFLLAGSAICLAVFAIGLFAPPNTADSMTYHMARVAHWVQQGNVEHYPTAILRQLYQNPLAEYTILHLQLLAGDDRFANLVQFASFLGCGGAVSLICGHFGLDRKMQAASFLLAATIPMAVLQGSGTQNDLVVAFFTLLFFYFYLRFAAAGGSAECVYAGLALGAALLSKGTAYPFCFAIGAVIFAAFVVHKNGERARLQFSVRTVVIGLIAFAMAAPMLVRNFETFGSPLTSGEDKVANSRLTPGIAASTLFRNYAVHLGTVSEDLNAAVRSTGEAILGSELDNPESTYLEIPFSVSGSLSEDSTGNLLHVLLITLSLPFAFFSRRSAEKKPLAITALAVVSGFLVFCLVLKWQPWASRLQLPLFMLSVPLIAAMLARLGSRATSIAALACAAGTLPFLLCGEPRPALSVFTLDRREQYFANRSDLAQPLAEAAQILREAGAAEVGLDLSTDYKYYKAGDWDYAMWISLKQDFAAVPRVRHVGVENVSARLRTEAAPEWVISTKESDTIDGQRYAEVWRSRLVRVLRKEAGQERRVQGVEVD